MPTPSIQTLVTDAQQVLNLDSISAVRSVVAVALANANTGTPLNPNLTTQQLWNEFYQVVTKPKSDIESIIANQLMKFLFAPPAPGGLGANGQVIFNDGGVLAGDPQFLWNKTTNLLTVTGSATITGDLTVDTSTLKVDSALNRVGVGTASPAFTLDVQATVAGAVYGSVANNDTGGSGSACFRVFNSGDVSDGFAIINNYGAAGQVNLLNYKASSLALWTNSVERFTISSTGVATWSNVGGVAGTAMILNSTGLGIGTTVLGGNKLAIGSTSDTSATTNAINIVTNRATITTTCNGAVDAAGTTINYSWANGGQGPLIFRNASISNVMTLDSSGNVISNVTSTAPTLGTNNQMVFNLTSNTNLRISVRGSDGTTRVANITLA